jgi:hypothetical protein
MKQQMRTQFQSGHLNRRYYLEIPNGYEDIIKGISRRLEFLTNSRQCPVKGFYEYGTKASGSIQQDG